MYARRCFAMVFRDIDSNVDIQQRPDWKYRDKATQIQSLDALAKAKSLMYINGRGILSLHSGQSLHKSIKSYWQHCKGKQHGMAFMWQNATQSISSKAWAELEEAEERLAALKETDAAEEAGHESIHAGQSPRVELVAFIIID